jgi:hypothetical protein
VTACAVTFDGRRVVSASADHTLKVWDLDTGRAVATLAGHADAVTACAVTPDGRRMVSTSDDHTLKVWDLATGACILTHRANTSFSAVIATETAIIAGDSIGSLRFLDMPAPAHPEPSSPGLPMKRAMADGRTFDVFLSHNSKDKPAVRRLKDLLVEHEVAVWLDEDQLQPGLPWQRLLESAIKNSRTVAVLVGEDGLGPWEDEEAQAALYLAVQDGRPVIPVLLPGSPTAPELPLFLANRTWVDLRDGFTEEAVARLIWGITGQRPRSR